MSFFQSLGVAPEQVELDKLLFKEGMSVLDVGGGTGDIALRMRQEYKVTVDVLQPTDCEFGVQGFNACIQKLGKNCVFDLTAQKAAEDKRFDQKYDVITVFKYNVPFGEQDDFFNALRKMLKPDGMLYVTVVDAFRLTSPYGEGSKYFLPYLIEKHFPAFLEEPISNDRYNYTSFKCFLKARPEVQDRRACV